MYAIKQQIRTILRNNNLVYIKCAIIKQYTFNSTWKVHFTACWKLCYTRLCVGSIFTFAWRNILFVRHFFCTSLLWHDLCINIRNWRTFNFISVVYLTVCIALYTNMDGLYFYWNWHIDMRDDTNLKIE